MAQDVVLGDAAGEPGAGDGADIEIVLRGDLPHQRRGPAPQPLFERFSASVVAGGIGGLTGRRGLGDGRRVASGGLRWGCGLRAGRRLRGGGEAGAAAWGTGVEAGADAAALASVSIRATTVCTATVSPSFTRISASTPAVGDGISASTLSVEISKMGSSRWTLSPAFFIQRDSVPRRSIRPSGA